MRAWAVLLCLGHTGLALLLTSPGSEAKRYDPSMVDPLSRRSTLDKNFMRFGRSSPSFTEEDEVEDVGDSLSGAGTNKEDNFLRSMRGKDNFIRFGRARNDNFMRFGRGKQDNYMRFGKSEDKGLMRFTRGKQDSYMRFGRGKEDDNLMRYGRGKQDNYMRFGRSKQDNFMRFGKGKEDTLMRLGRGKQDNFMRFGRGKQDSYMRFGRNYEVAPRFQPHTFDQDKITQPEVFRDLRGKQDNFMRFGKNLADDLDIGIPIAMRSSNSNFMRFGRARQDSFMRFGKSDDKNKSDNPSVANLIRLQRQPSTKGDGFIRYGRNSQEQPGTSVEPELIPPRLKRSISTVYDSQDDFLPSKQQDEVYDHILVPFSSLPDDLEEEYSTQQLQEDYMNRKKRSVTYDSSTPPSLVEEDRGVDYISAKLRFNSPANPVFNPESLKYQTSLLSAGLPNVIIGPEFSLLPDLDPPSNMLKRGRPGDQNFLRLG